MKRAERHDKGKPELYYLDSWPTALNEVARVCTNGAKKYTRGNYLLGQPYSELISAAHRHGFKFGNHLTPDYDRESGCHHIAHQIWNLLQLLELALRKETADKWDDRLCPPKE